MNPEQLTGIRKSCALAANCLKFINPYIKPGITTLALNDLIHNYIIDNKATPAALNYKGFPKSVCISVNEIVCHGIPDEYELKEGDIVSIDVATILDGYYGDTCKTFMLEPVSQRAKHLVRVTEKAMMVGIEQIKAGNYYANIGYAITEYCKKQGVGIVTEYLAHETGLSFHGNFSYCHYSEVKNTGPVIKSGQIITCEPMLVLGDPAIEILGDGWSAKAKGLEQLNLNLWKSEECSGKYDEKTL